MPNRCSVVSGLQYPESPAGGASAWAGTKEVGGPRASTAPCQQVPLSCSPRARSVTQRVQRGHRVRPLSHPGSEAATLSLMCPCKTAAHACNPGHSGAGGGRIAVEVGRAVAPGPEFKSQYSRQSHPAPPQIMSTFQSSVPACRLWLGLHLGVAVGSGVHNLNEDPQDAVRADPSVASSFYVPITPLARLPNGSTALNFSPNPTHSCFES